MTDGNYKVTWEALDRDALRERAADRPALVRRRLAADPLQPELHLAVDTADGLRMLLVRMPDDWDGDISSLPRWQGMRPGIMGGEERPAPRKFLVLRQEPGSPPEIFETVVADVCSALLKEGRQDVAGVVSARLGRWKVFFEEVGIHGLGPEAQQGLFGELWLLAERILPSLGPDLAVQAWTGPKHAQHDYQYARHALEVKTSTAKQHQKIRMANELQLETHGLDSLTLVFLSFATVEGGGGTLPELVSSIRRVVGSSPLATRNFEEKLLEAGYIDVHANAYRTGYVLRSIRTYHVAEDFPRIREKDLPEGVGDVSFSIALAACEPFRVPQESVWERLLDRTRGGSTQ